MDGGTFALIPEPVSCIRRDGEFRFTDQTAIVVRGAAGAESFATGLLLESLSSFYGLNCRTDARAAADGLILLETTVDGAYPAEGYRLTIDRKQVTVRARDASGLLYGMRTILQLLPAVGDRVSPTLPACEVEDYPRFRWRGMHLDVVRHYFPVSFIKKYIDQLSRHKMNVFHWHLTDDQGWRLEIGAFPRLTGVGAMRREADGSLYGGFYTQDDVRSVVAFARERGVTVVPEIDLPGHVRAVLAAYPELGCRREAMPVPSEWGIFDDVLCVGNEEVRRFTEAVLAEVIDLFPGRYLHIGGDECPTVRWAACPRCREAAEQHGGGADKLQRWFVEQVRVFVERRGKLLLGWDEIYHKHLALSVEVMVWRGAEYGRLASAAGHRVVMSPTSHCYFDYYQGKEGEPKAIGGYLPLEQVYAFDPLKGIARSTSPEVVLGGQGNVWTEYMPTVEQVEYMTFPRLCALAEVLWSPDQSRNFAGFLRRLPIHLGRLDRAGVKYRPLDNDVGITG